MLVLGEVVLWTIIMVLAPFLALWAIVGQSERPPPRSAEDEFLLLLLAAFYLLKAVLIERRDRLGWSFAASQVALAALFAWAYAVPHHPALADPTLGTWLRRAAVITVFWAIFELLWRRFLINSGPARTLRVAWRNRDPESRYRYGSGAQRSPGGTVGTLPGAGDQEDHGPRPTDHPRSAQDVEPEHQVGGG